MLEYEIIRGGVVLNLEARVNSEGISREDVVRHGGSVELEKGNESVKELLKKAVIAERIRFVCKRDPFLSYPFLPLYSYRPRLWSHFFRNKVGYIVQPHHNRKAP